MILRIIRVPRVSSGYGAIHTGYTAGVEARVILHASPSKLRGGGHVQSSAVARSVTQSHTWTGSCCAARALILQYKKMIFGADAKKATFVQ